jgi:hypothetical protein
MLRLLFRFACILFLLVPSFAAEAPTRIEVHPSRLRQEYQGLGCGAIFYEGHITSLAANQKTDLQKSLYDDLFAKVPTQFLQLMIRHDHEPQNDDGDPWKQSFDPSNFKYCEHTLAIAKAARERIPGIQLFATLYTPPGWMKTNNSESGGGQSKATIKPGMELEVAEFIWAFLAHMAHNGAPIQYLSIANEPDWPHEQPGYSLTPEAYAELFKVVAAYLSKVGAQQKDVPIPKLVGPNTLSAPDAAKRYVPELLRKAGNQLAVIASHDYDMRGDRWGDLQKLAKGRPVWLSEWCSRREDTSPGQIKAPRSMEWPCTMPSTAGRTYSWPTPGLIRRARWRSAGAHRLGQRLRTEEAVLALSAMGGTVDSRDARGRHFDQWARRIEAGRIGHQTDGIPQSRRTEVGCACCQCAGEGGCDHSECVGCVCDSDVRCAASDQRRRG